MGFSESRKKNPVLLFASLLLFLVPLPWFRRGPRVYGHFAFLALVSVSALVASLAVWIPQGADRLQGEMQMAADHGQQRSIAPILAPKASSALVPVALSLTFCVFSAVSSWERRTSD